MASSPAIATTTAVYNHGPYPVAVKHVEVSNCNEVVKDKPISVMVVSPIDEGKYPVVLFLNGWIIVNSFYQQLLKHVASHGFIAVAPQLTALGLDDRDDLSATRQVAAWVKDKHNGLASVLDGVFYLHGTVKPDLSRLALAGHSRGGDTAFAVALGLHDDETAATPEPEPTKFSALIGVDPVAGFFKQVNPEVLTNEPNSLDTGMPVLVLGTGLGGPFAPPGFNHVEFYNECVPHRHKYHFVLRDFGHICMLDDLPCWIFGANDDARRTVGGLMVAFLRAKLQDKDMDLNIVLAKCHGNPPAVLDPVEHV